MALLGRIQELTTAEQRVLLVRLCQGELNRSEATVAMKLLQEVLEEHVALSEELAKLGTYIRHHYTRTVRGQNDSLEQITSLARSALPLVACQAS